MAKTTKTGPSGNVSKKTEAVRTKSGSTVTVRKSTVEDARANKGVFQERPAYKGKVVRASNGSISGTKSHDGTYTPTTGPVARRAATKALDRERRIYKADSTAHSNTIKRFQNPVAKKKK